MFYSLPFEKPAVQGALYLMAVVNLQVVHRSWGLFELATRSPDLVLSTSPQSGEHEDRTEWSYGPQFKYEEFLALPSRLHSLLVVLFLFTVALAMKLFPPVGVALVGFSNHSLISLYHRLGHWPVGSCRSRVMVPLMSTPAHRWT